MTDQNIVIHLKFFGAFKSHGSGCDLSIPQGSNIAAIKAIFAKERPDIDAALITSSALANDHAVLASDDVLEDAATLSILPPVCGG